MLHGAKKTYLVVDGRTLYVFRSSHDELHQEEFDLRSVPFELLSAKKKFGFKIGSKATFLTAKADDAEDWVAALTQARDARPEDEEPEWGEGEVNDQEASASFHLEELPISAHPDRVTLLASWRPDFDENDAAASSSATPPAQPIEYAFDLGLDPAEQIRAVCELVGAPHDPEHAALFVEEVNGYLSEPGFESVYRALCQGYDQARLLVVTHPDIRALREFERLSNQSLLSDDSPESLRELKMAVFQLKAKLEDGDFADEFIELGGMTALMNIVSETDGNTQSYALTALRAAMGYVSGIKEVFDDPSLVTQLFELVEQDFSEESSITVPRNALALLIVLTATASDFGLNGFELITRAAVTAAERSPNSVPYKCLVDFIRPGDVETNINALMLINTILALSPSEEARAELVEIFESFGASRELSAQAESVRFKSWRIQSERYQDLSGVPVFPKMVRLMNRVKDAETALEEFKKREPLVRVLHHRLNRAQTIVQEAISSSSLDPLARFADAQEVSAENGILDIMQYKTEDEAALLREISSLNEQLEQKALDVDRLKGALSGAKADLKTLEGEHAGSAAIIATLEAAKAALEGERDAALEGKALAEEEAAKAAKAAAELPPLPPPDTPPADGGASSSEIDAALEKERAQAEILKKKIAAKDAEIAKLKKELAAAQAGGGSSSSSSAAPPPPAANPPPPPPPPGGAPPPPPPPPPGGAPPPPPPLPESSSVGRKLKVWL